MRVVVLGAGVIGVTTAYYLARAGHEVTVLDRQSGSGLETSFANAGEVTPGYTAPWAAPGMPLKALKWIFTKHAPLAISGMPSWAAVRWVLSMLANCDARKHAVNKERMVRLAVFSRDCLIALRDETGLLYDHGTLGTLHLFRTKKQLETVCEYAMQSHKPSSRVEILDRAGCIEAEPGLAFARGTVAGGIRLLDDETGDCHLFTCALQRLAERLGAIFAFNVKINALRVEKSQITAAETSAGDVRADAYVAALGSYTPRILKPLGVRLPVYPLKGYSLTLPILHATRSPKSTILDETYKIAITRLGDRIRVGGMAEIAGFSSDLPHSRRETLELAVESLFPGAGNMGEALYWSGLRPMTPDGPPVLGPTHYPNLYLNTGHGTFGWTMACGSGQVLSDLISERAASISIEGLSLSRYRN